MRSVEAVIRKGILNDIERHCPMLKSKEKESAFIVEQVHDDDDDYVLITSCNNGVYDNNWVLDSGCTLHMTFRRY